MTWRNEAASNFLNSAFAKSSQQPTDNQSCHQAGNSKDFRRVFGHVQYDVVKKICGSVQAGDEPAAVLLDQCGGPAAFHIKVLAVRQFKLLIGAAKANPGVFSVQTGQFVHVDGAVHAIHNSIWAGHDFIEISADAVMTAADFGIVPGDDTVGVEKFKRALKIAFVHRFQQSVPQLAQFLVGGILIGGSGALCPEAGNTQDQGDRQH